MAISNNMRKGLDFETNQDERFSFEMFERRFAFPESGPRGPLLDEQIVDALPQRFAWLVVLQNSFPAHRDCCRAAISIDRSRSL